MIVNVQPLRDRLEKIVGAQTENLDISVYVEMLNTGANVSINPNVRIFPASLTKLPLAMAILKQEQLGFLTLGKKLTISEDDLNGESGQLYKLGIGHSLSIKELLEVMLKDSDNTAYNMLRSQVSTADLQNVVNAIGLGEIFKAGGSLSALEYARLLRGLYSGVYLSRKHSAYMLDSISKTEFKDFLSNSLPDTVTFAHKWGGNYREKIYADAGIVYESNRPFMIVVLIHGKEGLDTTMSAELATLSMKDIGLTSYEYVRDYKGELAPPGEHPENRHKAQ